MWFPIKCGIFGLFSGIISYGFFDLCNLDCFGSLLVKRIQRITTADDTIARGSGAVAEGAAQAFTLQRFTRQHIGSKLRVTEHHASQADKINLVITDDALRHIRQPFL